MRTAEGLQVKGLAVPDDAVLSSRMRKNTGPHDACTAENSVVNNTNNHQPTFTSALPVKRKRPSGIKCIIY